MENIDYQRIEKTRKMLDFANFKEFGEKIGVSSQVFYDIKAGKHGISKTLAEKIHAYDERISVAWLLTGDGEEMAKAVPMESDMSYLLRIVEDHDVRFHELAHRILDGMGVPRTTTQQTA